MYKVGDKIELRLYENESRTKVYIITNSNGYPILVKQIATLAIVSITILLVGAIISWIIFYNKNNYLP
jgi:hypothetical protein